jgi:hypothetical protein
MSPGITPIAAGQSGWSCLWRFRDRYKMSKVFFLLILFTDSYAASRNQQSLPLFPGVASGKSHPPRIIQKTVIKQQARSFSCSFYLRTLMPHPGNSSLYRCFLVWRPASHLRRRSVIKRAGLFLLFVFTASYAAFRKQQSLPLYPGVAFGKSSPSAAKKKREAKFTLTHTT